MSVRSDTDVNGRPGSPILLGFISCVLVVWIRTLQNSPVLKHRKVTYPSLSDLHRWMLEQV